MLPFPPPSPFRHSSPILWFCFVFITNFARFLSRRFTTCSPDRVSCSPLETPLCKVPLWGLSRVLCRPVSYRSTLLSRPTCMHFSMCELELQNDLHTCVCLCIPWLFSLSLYVHACSIYPAAAPSPHMFSTAGHVLPWSEQVPVSFRTSALSCPSLEWSSCALRAVHDFGHRSRAGLPLSHVFFEIVDPSKQMLLAPSRHKVRTPIVQYDILHFTSHHKSLPLSPIHK